MSPQSLIPSLALIFLPFIDRTLLSTESIRTESTHQCTVRSFFLPRAACFIYSYHRQRHQRNRSYICECGRAFLDPAACSRCRGGHQRLWLCPAVGCTLEFVPLCSAGRSQSLKRCICRTRRKDSVKAHMRRRHPDLVQLGLQILMVPLGDGHSGRPSNLRLAPGYAPIPSGQIYPPSFVVNPESDGSSSSVSQSPPYSPEGSTDSWSQFG